VVVLLLPLPALAETFALGEGDDLVDIVEEAALTPGADTIRVASNYDSNGVGVDVSGQSLAFEPLDGDAYELPPLYGSSATLKITGAVITGAVAFPDPDLSWDDASCALCLDSSAVELSDVEVATDKANHGILVRDTSVSADGLTVRDTPGRGFSHYSRSAETAVTLSGSEFRGNTGGAIKVYNGGGDVDFTLHDSQVHDNQAQGSAGLDVYGEDVAVVDTSFVDNVSQGGSTLQFMTAGGTFDGVQITENFGTWGSLLYGELGGHELVFSRCILAGGRTDSDETDYEGIVAGAGKFSVTGCAWAPRGTFKRHGGSMHVEDNLIGVTRGRIGVIYGLETSLTITANRFCGGSTTLDAFQGLVMASGSSVLFEQNVVTGVLASGALLRSGGIDATGLEGSDFEIFDNTFVANDTVALYAGDTTGLVFVNNLVRESIAHFDLESFPEEARGDYNLWHGVTPTAGVNFPGDWGANDVTDQDPLLVDTFDPTDCDSEPGLQDGSPAIDAGDPTRTDADGQSRSDIGAIDGTPGAGPSDEVDADGDGYPAAVDCDDGNAQVNPGLADDPYDNIDQDCDGRAATISYGGGCACDGALAGSPAFLLLALARRRR